MKLRIHNLKAAAEGNQTVTNGSEFEVAPLGNSNRGTGGIYMWNSICN